MNRGECRHIWQSHGWFGPFFSTPGSTLYTYDQCWPWVGSVIRIGATENEGSERTSSNGDFFGSWPLLVSALLRLAAIGDCFFPHATFHIVSLLSEFQLSLPDVSFPLSSRNRLLRTAVETAEDSAPMWMPTQT